MTIIEDRGFSKTFSFSGKKKQNILEHPVNTLLFRACMCLFAFFIYDIMLKGGHTEKLFVFTAYTLMICIIMTNVMLFRSRFEKKNIPGIGINDVSNKKDPLQQIKQACEHGLHFVGCESRKTENIVQKRINRPLKCDCEFCITPDKIQPINVGNHRMFAVTPNQKHQNVDLSDIMKFTLPMIYLIGNVYLSSKQKQDKPGNVDFLHQLYAAFNAGKMEGNNSQNEQDMSSKIKIMSEIFQHYQQHVNKNQNVKNVNNPIQKQNETDGIKVTGTEISNPVNEEIKVSSPEPNPENKTDLPKQNNPIINGLADIVGQGNPEITRALTNLGTMVYQNFATNGIVPTIRTDSRPISPESPTEGFNVDIN